MIRHRRPVPISCDGWWLIGRRPALTPDVTATPPVVDEAATSDVLKNLDPEARSLVLRAQADAAQATEVAKAATAEPPKNSGCATPTANPSSRRARNVAAASSALSESSLFTAAGSPTSSSGLSELDVAVLKAREFHPDATKSRFIAEAVPANPDPYDSYRASPSLGSSTC